MKRKDFTIASIVLSFLVLTFLAKGQSKNENTHHPDYVPDTLTAIRIAEAVWLPIYGKKIYDEQPFKAVLHNDSTWHVFGYLPPSHISINGNGDTTLTIIRGGVAEILINKSDGRIIDVRHGR
ncbi:MAG TPA: YbbC/YhhH family protein [Bacteroidia bacterium]|jgi:hypothetical protein|nr:YbbC/YhhH family protein [Bacteroidia bacterium]